MGNLIRRSISRKRVWSNLIDCHQIGALEFDDDSLWEVWAMKDVERAAAIRGKTIRFVWAEGPTKGKTHEHVFYQDGTVTWTDADTTKAAQPSGSAPAGSAKEKPQYAATRVTDQIYAVSYLASSGYTLTVVLNFADQQLVGFASGAKDWYPVRGTFQVVK